MESAPFSRPARFRAPEPVIAKGIPALAGGGKILLTYVNAAAAIHHGCGVRSYCPEIRLAKTTEAGPAIPETRKYTAPDRSRRNEDTEEKGRDPVHRRWRQFARQDAAGGADLPLR